jgi:hypothetical protein
MRTLGDVIMIAAALALFAIAVAAGYELYNRLWRQLRRPGEWLFSRSPYRLKFFDEHSAWALFLPFFLILGVGWGPRHCG